MNSRSPDVLIVGASARSAAMSAVRAGWRVWAADLFGDEDLREVATQYRQIKAYRELVRLIADWPGREMPWIVTGALENCPRLIERLSQRSPHWGNPADVMRNVRRPMRLYEALLKKNLPALAIWPEKTPPPPDGRWMLKPRRSAGGRGVLVWDEQSARSSEAASTLRKPHYFQQRAEGEAMSAVFLSDQQQITLIGVSRQLSANAPGPRFGYGGAIGPVNVPAAQDAAIRKLGQAVLEVFALRGLWGMDLICGGSGASICEINPRYTATVELYEQAQGQVLFPLHRRACEDWRPFQAPSIFGERRGQRAKSSCVGKIVIYADRDLSVPAWGEWASARDPLLEELSVVADRPRSGSMVPRGHPICTLFAAGETEADCRGKLNERLEAFRRHFQNAGQPIFVPQIADR